MVHESKKKMKIFFSLHSYVISHTVKTLRLTVISPFGTLGRGGGGGGGGDKGIWRMVHAYLRKNPGYAKLVRIVPYSTLPLFKSGASADFGGGTDGGCKSTGPPNVLFESCYT